jgi:hypothetical protein
LPSWLLCVCVCVCVCVSVPCTCPCRCAGWAGGTSHSFTGSFASSVPSQALSLLRLSKYLPVQVWTAVQRAVKTDIGLPMVSDKDVDMGEVALLLSTLQPEALLGLLGEVGGNSRDPIHILDLHAGLVVSACSIVRCPSGGQPGPQCPFRHLPAATTSPLQSLPCFPNNNPLRRSAPLLLLVGDWVGAGHVWRGPGVPANDARECAAR